MQHWQSSTATAERASFRCPSRPQYPLGSDVHLGMRPRVIAVRPCSAGGHVPGPAPHAGRDVWLPGPLRGVGVVLHVDTAEQSMTSRPLLHTCAEVEGGSADAAHVKRLDVCTAAA